MALFLEWIIENTHFKVIPPTPAIKLEETVLKIKWYRLITTSERNVWRRLLIIATHNIEGIGLHIQYTGLLWWMCKLVSKKGLLFFTAYTVEFNYLKNINIYHCIAMRSTACDARYKTEADGSPPKTMSSFTRSLNRIIRRILPGNRLHNCYRSVSVINKSFICLLYIKWRQK